MRSIAPIDNGFHSYAVAWASRRDDGAPFVVSVKLADLRLTYKLGYHVKVSLFQAQYFLAIFNHPHFFKDLFDENHLFDVQSPKNNFNVRMNPSGKLKSKK